MTTLLPRSRRRVAALVAAAAVAAAAALAATPATTAQAQPASCVSVEYESTTWSETPDRGGFVITVTLTSLCDSPIDGWTLELGLAPGHEVNQVWNVNAIFSSGSITANPPPWNARINPGGSVSFGMMGTWSGTFQPPTSCSVNGEPCLGEGEGQAPVVALTRPGEFGLTVFPPCPVTTIAEASDPDGAIDRVEFYADGALVSADDAAPYHAQVPARSGTVVFARAYDDGTPQRSTDSDPVTLMIAVPTLPPPNTLAVLPCLDALELPAGNSQEVVFGTLFDAVDLSFTVDGDPGVTVSSVAPSAGGLTAVTVTAAPGATGATATVTPSVDDPQAVVDSVTVTVT